MSTIPCEIVQRVGAADGASSVNVTGGQVRECDVMDCCLPRQMPVEFEPMQSDSDGFNLIYDSETTS